MKNYIPKSKDDQAAINNLYKCAFEQIEPDDIAELLKWMQDMHWDVSHPIASYLLPHVNEIKDDLLNILNSDDNEWKHGILSFLLAESPHKLDRELLSALERIAKQPAKGETFEDLDALAKEIIAGQVNKFDTD